MTFRKVMDHVISRMDRNCRIGWIDFCSDSYDMQCARERAYRIIQRLNRNRSAP